jgi:hypothetical protein
MKAWKGRAPDFAIYIAVAISLVAGLVWYSSVSGPNGADLFGRWGGLVVNTAVLFAYMIKDGRREWHLRPFWVLTVSLLVAHIAAFTFILLYTPVWKVIWFLAMYPIEVPLFITLRDRVVNADRPSRHLQ